jgi:hypothetical protein
MRRKTNLTHLAIAIGVAITTAGAFYFLAHLALTGSILVAAILSTICLIALQASER